MCSTLRRRQFRFGMTRQPHERAREAPIESRAEKA